jgi:hypothetical protein
LKPVQRPALSGDRIIERGNCRVSQSKPKIIAPRKTNVAPTVNSFRGFMKVIEVASLCFVSHHNAERALSEQENSFRSAQGLTKAKARLELYSTLSIC